MGSTDLKEGPVLQLTVAGPQGSPNAVVPLSEEEIDRLAGFLDAQSTLDVAALLGLLHAVALAPGLVSPSAWLPVVLPRGVEGISRTEAEAFLSLLFRLHADIVNALQGQEALFPDPEDVEDCTSFAAGYAAGAELDPMWIGDPALWSYAQPMAYLGGRPDLLRAEMIEKLERKFGPDPDLAICRGLGELLYTTEESFRNLRQRHASMLAAVQGQVGRNDPCPCGSGKKYKRCCIDAAQRADAD